MNITRFHQLMRNIPFRKEFYLVSLLLLMVLIISNYKILPVLFKNNTSTYRGLNSLINFLIFAVSAMIVIFSLLFWLNGNN